MKLLSDKVNIILTVLWVNLFNPVFSQKEPEEVKSFEYGEFNFFNASIGLSPFNFKPYNIDTTISPSICVKKGRFAINSKYQVELIKYLSNRVYATDHINSSVYENEISNNINLNLTFTFFNQKYSNYLNISNHNSVSIGFEKGVTSYLLSNFSSNESNICYHFNSI